MMEKIDFGSFVVETDKELIKKLKNNKIILRFLKENNLPLNFIDNHSQKLNNYLKHLKICDGCKGLNYCKQSIYGRVYKLEYDGILSNVLVPCKYKVKDFLSKKHLSNYVVNDLSNKFLTVNFEDIELEKEDDKYLESLSIIIDAIEKKNKGIYLFGKTGTGKTYLAACACNKFAKDGYKVAFVNIPLFSQRIKNNFENNEYKNEVGAIIKADFVVLDDIGSESVTSWFRDEILFTILNERMENNSLTWFTSNEDFKSLQSHFEISNRKVEEKVKGERIMSRIKCLSKLVKIMGKDRRNG